MIEVLLIACWLVMLCVSALLTKCDSDVPFLAAFALGVACLFGWGYMVHERVQQGPGAREGRALATIAAATATAGAGPTFAALATLEAQARAAATAAGEGK